MWRFGWESSVATEMAATCRKIRRQRGHHIASPRWRKTRGEKQKLVCQRPSPSHDLLETTATGFFTVKLRQADICVYRYVTIRPPPLLSSPIPPSPPFSSWPHCTDDQLSSLRAVLRHLNANRREFVFQ